MNPQQLDSFLSRYVAMWHEPDPERRRTLVEALWAEDAENTTRNFTARGLPAIVARVTRAHEEWVAAKRFVFRPTGNSDAHNHLVKFSWEMAPSVGGPAEARGLDIFVLNEDGRIRALYQFAEPLPA